MIMILDPLSSKLPDDITQNWSSATAAYEISRKFTYRMHLKREKIYKEIDNIMWIVAIYTIVTFYCHNPLSLNVIGHVDRF